MRPSEYGTHCGICGDEIPYEDPLLFKKVETTRHGFQKVPACMDCVTYAWDLWGSMTRELSGRTLEALPCRLCGRQMLIYWRRGDSCLCSGWCRREAHRAYNADLRRKARQLPA